MRYSLQREAILEIIRATNSHPTADWIYEQARKTIPNISLGTVYRNLNQLVEGGIINSIKDNTVVRYDGNVNHHDHFKCLNCGTVYDVAVLDQDFIASLNRDHDFRIEKLTLDMQGTCGSCLLSK